MCPECMKTFERKPTDGLRIRETLLTVMDTLRLRWEDPVEKLMEAFEAIGVFAACEAIRTRVCEGITAREVAATFPCSRRMADIRFRRSSSPRSSAIPP